MSIYIYLYILHSYKCQPFFVSLRHIFGEATRAKLSGIDIDAVVQERNEPLPRLCGINMPAGQLICRTRLVRVL